MTINEIEKLISEIDFPIISHWDNPRQLHLTLKWAYVHHYDPVISIEIDNKILKINNGNYIYEHKLNEFDNISVNKYIDD